MLIAIDGPVGAGKSSVARAVAAALGWTYLDTGAMYRSVALARLRERPFPERIDLGERVYADGIDVTLDIRAPGVSTMASRVAAEPEVRERLVEMQRALIAEGDYVAEGRDIGTVVAPDAEVKVFLTASDEERARRRAADEGRPLPDVLAELRERDARDRSREHSPLRPADDAVEIDSTGLTLDEVVARIVALVPR